MAIRVLIVGVLALLAGCSSAPSRANIELRKENQNLVATTQKLTDQLDAAQARIRGLQSQATTLPVLPESRIEKLFTTHRVEVGRLSHGVKLSEKSAGDDAVRVYFNPRDAEGDAIKATGHLTIAVYDLNRDESPLVARCELSPEKLKETWVGLLSRAFVIDCPLKTRPLSPELTVRVTFRDELTQRVLEDQRRVKIDPGPTTRP